MATGSAPIVWKEALSLTNLGVNQRFINFTHVTMESEKYICVRETAPSNSIVIIDMATPMQPLRRPFTADSALINPDSKILALKAALIKGTNHLRILDIEARAKFKSYRMPEEIVYWKWISNEVLGLVTLTSVYHWSIEGEVRPVKMFERTANLNGSQIINYQSDPSGKWLALIGIAPGAPERPQLVKGNMQLFSVDEQKSQALEAHVAAFASVKVPGNDTPSLVIAFATKTIAGGQLISRLHIMELGAQPGRVPFTKKQADLFFPPAFADDFPIAVQVSAKFGLVYVVTKLGLLFVYDLESATPIYRNRISPDVIFLAVDAPSVGGFYAVNHRGQVLLATVNEQTIVPFVSGQLNNPELAISLARRANLPGAENLMPRSSGRKGVVVAKTSARSRAPAVGRSGEKGRRVSQKEDLVCLQNSSSNVVNRTAPAITRQSLEAPCEEDPAAAEGAAAGAAAVAPPPPSAAEGVAAGAALVAPPPSAEAEGAAAGAAAAAAAAAAPPPSAAEEGAAAGAAAVAPPPLAAAEGAAAGAAAVTPPPSAVTERAAATAAAAAAAPPPSAAAEGAAAGAAAVAPPPSAVAEGAAAAAAAAAVAAAPPQSAAAEGAAAGAAAVAPPPSAVTERAAAAAAAAAPPPSAAAAAARRGRSAGVVVEKEVAQPYMCREYSLAELTEATGHWAEGNRIGNGGFGVVYKGVSPDCNQAWAVKRARVLTNDFQREVKWMASKHHPHLVRLLGYCIDFDPSTRNLEQILVYEFMPNSDLDSWIGPGVSSPLSLQQRLDVLIGVAKGLQYLHDFKIVHRDIKPANILLDGKMQAKVADFGLVKLLGGTSVAISEAATRLVGTLGYMDPEYCSSHKPSPAVDVYSFGVVMLVVVTGRKAVLVIEDDHVNIKRWVAPLVISGAVAEFKDPHLEAPDDVVLRLARLALSCTALPGVSRPSMLLVLAELVRIKQEMFGAQVSAEVSGIDTEIGGSDDYSDFSAEMARAIQAAVSGGSSTSMP